MRVPFRDQIATLFVALALIVVVAWAFDVPVPGFADARAVGVAVLVLGVAASASAVVPGFAELLHGSRVYAALASVLGLLALLAGILVIVTGDGSALVVFTVETVILWGMSTMRHMGFHWPVARLGHR